MGAIYVSATTNSSASASGDSVPAARVHDIAIGLLTGCQDRPYAFGLAMALISNGTQVDVIGSEEVDSPEMHSTPGLRFLNMRGSRIQGISLRKKVSKLLLYYV